MQPINNKIYTQDEVNKMIREAHKTEKNKYKKRLIKINETLSQIEQKDLEKYEEKIQENLIRKMEIAKKSALTIENASHDYKKLNNRKTTLESIGMGAGIGTIIVGSVISPFCLPLGICLIMAGTAGVTAGTTNLIKDASEDIKIKKVMNKQNISYAEAKEIVKSKK